jgi:O-glycosyl hydrolase
LRFWVSKEVLVASPTDFNTPVPLVDDLWTNVAAMDFNTESFNAGMALWLADNALEPDKVKLVGSVLSPPHWMKGPTGASQYFVTDPSVSHPTPWLSSGTYGASIGGRLLQDPNNLQQFARYIAAWVKGWEAQYGIPLYGITLQNELAFENPFDSCTYYSDENGNGGQYWQYANALNAVKDEFEDLEALYGPGFMNVKIMGPQHASLQTSPSNPWSLDWQTQFIKAVEDHADPTLIDFMEILANNYGAGSSYVAKMHRAYWEGKASMPTEPFPGSLYAPGFASMGKENWNVESGGQNGDFSGSLALAQDIHDKVVWGGLSAFIHWQFCNSGTAVTEHDLLYKGQLSNPTSSKKFCAAKHFFRPIRPGAERIAAVFDENGGPSYGNPTDLMRSDLSLNVSAYVHDEDRTITIVLVNRKSTTYPVTANVPSLYGIDTYSVHRTSATENFKRLTDVKVSAGQLSLTVPGESIVTLHGPPLVELIADFDHSDKTDYADLSTVAQDWLAMDYYEGPQDPGMYNLEAWWKLDEGSGTTAADSSGNGHDGAFPTDTANRPTWYNDPALGWVLSFDGSDYINCGGGRNVGADPCDPGTWTDPLNWANAYGGSFTIYARVNQTAVRPWGTFLGKGELEMKLQMLVGLNLTHFAFPRTPAGGLGGTKTWSNNIWYRITGVWDAEQEIAYVYRNGNLDNYVEWGADNPGMSGVLIDNDCDILLGAMLNEDYISAPYRQKIGGCPTIDGQPTVVNNFIGRLSDIRLYSKALSPDEIAYINEKGEPVYIPLDSQANIYDYEPEGSKAVNWYDLALLANEWLVSLE